MKKKLKEEFMEQSRVSSTQAVLRSQVIAEKLKINPIDLETLEILLREGKITAGKLADFTGLTTGAVTGLVDRLVKAGYAKRQADPADRRKILIELNEEKIYKEVMPLYSFIANSVDKLLDKYSEKELQLIIDFYKKANVLSQQDLEMIKNR